MTIDSSMIQFKDRANADSSVYPISIQKAIVDKPDGDDLTTYITEYNISLHQTNTTAGVGTPRRDTSVFTLSEAIAQVPEEYKHGGLKLTFNSDMLGVNCVRNYVLDSSVWTGNVKSWYEEGSNAMVGYYTCTTIGGTAAKTVNDASGYVLSLGGSMKIKFANKHTGNNTPTLNINGQGAKTIVYDGSICSSTNTWESGETVECYYDGSVYQLNNVAGGGTFKTGEKVKNVGIDDEPVAYSENMVNSNGILSSVFQSMSATKLKFDSNVTIHNKINTIVGHTYQIEVIENTTAYTTYHIWLNKIEYDEGEEIATIIRTWDQNFDISNFKYCFVAESNEYRFFVRGSSGEETHIKVTDITQLSLLNKNYNANIETLFIESAEIDSSFMGDLSAPIRVNYLNPAYFSQWEPLNDVVFLTKIENLIPSDTDDYIEVVVFDENGYFENLFKVDIKAGKTSTETNICVPKGHIVGLTEYGGRFRYRVLSEGETANVQCKACSRQSNDPLVDRPYTYGFVMCYSYTNPNNKILERVYGDSILVAKPEKTEIGYEIIPTNSLSPSSTDYLWSNQLTPFSKKVRIKKIKGFTSIAVDSLVYIGVIDENNVVKSISTATLYAGTSEIVLDDFVVNEGYTVAVGSSYSYPSAASDPTPIQFVYGESASDTNSFRILAQINADDLMYVQYKFNFVVCCEEYIPTINESLNSDKEPIYESDNLVKSGGSFDLITQSMSSAKLKFDSSIITISNYINTVVGHTYRIEIIENTTATRIYHIWLNKYEDETVTTVRTWDQNFDITNFKYDFTAVCNKYIFNIRGIDGEETHLKITDITQLSSLNSIYNSNIENIFTKSETPGGKFIGDTTAPNRVTNNTSSYFSQWEPLDDISFLVKIENLVPSDVDDYIEVAIFNEDGYFENLYKVGVKANSTSVDTNICVPKGYIVGLTDYGSRFRYRVLDEGEVADVQCKTSRRESNNPLTDHPYTYSFVMSYSYTNPNNKILEKVYGDSIPVQKPENGVIGYEITPTNNFGQSAVLYLWSNQLTPFNKKVRIKRIWGFSTVTVDTTVYIGIINKNNVVENIISKTLFAGTSEIILENTIVNEGYSIAVGSSYSSTYNVTTIQFLIDGDASNLYSFRVSNQIGAFDRLDVHYKFNFKIDYEEYVPTIKEEFGNSIIKENVSLIGSGLTRIGLSSADYFWIQWEPQKYDSHITKITGLYSDPNNNYTLYVGIYNTDRILERIEQYVIPTGAEFVYVDIILPKGYYIGVITSKEPGGTQTLISYRADITSDTRVCYLSSTAIGSSFFGVRKFSLSIGFEFSLIKNSINENEVNIKDACNVLVLGSSLTSAHYQPMGFAWLERLNDITDVCLINDAVSGKNLLNNIVSIISNSSIAKDINNVPLSINPKYIWWCNNANGTPWDISGTEQLNTAKKVTESLGAKMILGSEEDWAGRNQQDNHFPIQYEQFFKAWAKSNNILYSPIIKVWRKLHPKDVPYDGFIAAGHSGYRAVAPYQMHRELFETIQIVKGIKMFKVRPMYKGGSPTINDLCYDTNEDRLKYFTAVSAGSASGEGHPLISTSHLDNLGEYVDSSVYDVQGGNNDGVKISEVSVLNRYGFVDFNNFALIETILDKVLTTSFEFSIISNAIPENIYLAISVSSSETIPSTRTTFIPIAFTYDEVTDTESESHVYRISSKVRRYFPDIQVYDKIRIIIKHSGDFSLSSPKIFNYDGIEKQYTNKEYGYRKFGTELNTLTSFPLTGHGWTLSTNASVKALPQQFANYTSYNSTKSHLQLDSDSDYATKTISVSNVRKVAIRIVCLNWMKLTTTRFNGTSIENSEYIGASGPNVNTYEYDYGKLVCTINDTAVKEFIVQPGWQELYFEYDCEESDTSLKIKLGRKSFIDNSYRNHNRPIFIHDVSVQQIND